MTVGDNIADAETRHTVYLLRYARSTYRKHSNLIDKALADLTGTINARAPSDNSFTRRRLEGVLASIRETSQTLYKGLQEGIEGDLRELADYEAGFQQRIIEEAYPIQLDLTKVTGAQVHSAAMAKPFQGKVLRDWFRDQEYGVRRAFESAVRLGFVEGESIPQIASRVKGVGNMTRRQVESIVRTATRHHSQVAMNTVAQANSDIIDEEEYVATLDGRTTLECASRDGNRYEVGKGPQVPAHHGCRSVRVPVPKTFDELFGRIGEDKPLASRRFVADTRRVKDIPKSVRDQLTGRTTKTYNQWLKTQNKGFVEDVLGKQKAKLYLDGDLSIDKFVDRQGSEYTLEQLAKREAQAFEKAGLEAA